MLSWKNTFVVPLFYKIERRFYVAHISHRTKHGSVSAQIKIYSFEVASTIFLYFVYWSSAGSFNKNVNFRIRPAFNFEKPSALEIFRIILIDAAKYEETRPLKSVRENKVYTIRNKTLESIPCDDKRTFHDEINNHSTVTVSTCDKEDGIFRYKEKTGQGYTKCPVEEEDVFELGK